MVNYRLNENCILDLLQISRQGGYPVTIGIAIEICKGTEPVEPCTQVYGIYNRRRELVSVMTATYALVFPESTGTRIVQISGAYTKEEFRHRGFATSLINAIRSDAIEHFHADYLCCDSTADSLYRKTGFVPAPADETRMWLRI